MIAQGSHASLASVLRIQESGSEIEKIKLKDWLADSFTKITLSVSSEEELLSIYDKSKNLGLSVVLITDNGQTEFSGVKTNTCLCIGPDLAKNINPITKDLKLL